MHLNRLALDGVQMTEPASLSGGNRYQLVLLVKKERKET